MNWAQDIFYLCGKLLPYQENSIAKHQFSIFPKAAEKHIVCQVSDTAPAHILDGEQQSVFQFRLECCPYKARHLVLFLYYSYIPAIFHEFINNIILFECKIMIRITKGQWMRII